MSGIYYPIVHFPFLGNPCCPTFSSFVNARFAGAFFGLWKLISSFLSLWGIMSEHSFSCGSSFYFSFLSFMRTHVRASRILWKFIFAQPSFVCVSSCPTVSSYVEAHIVWCGSSCWPMISSCLNCMCKLYVCPVVIIYIQIVSFAQGFLGT